jgi:uncharacterized protein YqhQ
VNGEIRLGGMALENGVLVHGPRYWACAVRLDDGTVRLASDRKSLRSVDVTSPVLRGPARVAEAVAVLPALRRALPEARLPFFSARAVAAMVGTTIAVRSLRSSGLSPALQEVAAALLAVIPATATLRGSDLAAYHGAEHISIGSYEHGELRPREHERCGSHILGPLLVTTAAGNALVSSFSPPGRRRSLARLGVGIGSLAAATELFAWTLRHPDNAISRALAWPGRELQTRVLTAEPTPAQLEVAQEALAECLELELRDAAARAGGANGDL